MTLIILHASSVVMFPVEFDSVINLLNIGYIRSYFSLCYGTLSVVMEIIILIEYIYCVDIVVLKFRIFTLCCSFFLSAFAVLN